MNQILSEIKKIGIIPVIAIDDADKTRDLMQALKEGGLPAAEITFRTKAGQEAIKIAAESYPDMMIGAGTVLSVEQVKMAAANGAKYIVSPGYNEDVVDYCLNNGITVIPGCSNASDMTKAVNAGLDTVKYFPAETLGGLPYLKSLAPVFTSLSFMPTGGVNADNVKDYLSYDRVSSCGGTWIAKKEMINAGKWYEITEICKKAVNAMLDFRLRHIGINCNDKADAEMSADWADELFNFKKTEAPISFFNGAQLEFMFNDLRGTMGHIAIGTSDVERAVYHLSKKGVEFDPESCKYTDSGRLRFIYIKNEVNGFAYHLTLN